MNNKISQNIINPGQ